MSNTGITVKKDGLAIAIAEATGTSKVDASAALDAVFAALTGALENGSSVDLAGIGKFNLIDKPARQARNPSTGQPVDVPAKTVVQFKPAKALREGVNK